jgi:hypothetical protein
MKQLPLRPVLIGLVVLVAAVGLTRIVPSGQVSPSNYSPGSTSAKGAFDGPCNAQNPGVSLVVDFGRDSARTPIVKCARGFNFAGSSVSNELNGWQLFAAAGLSVTGTAEYPVGFVCRIGDFPLAADQPCTSTPTYTQGHWAYFVSRAGNGSSGNWAFSGAGASEHKPSCGSSEGWLFVKGNAATGDGSNQYPRVAAKVFSCAP